MAGATTQEQDRHRRVETAQAADQAVRGLSVVCWLYLSAPVNTAQVCALNHSVAPLGFLVSRTSTRPWSSAPASTHSLPPPPL